MNLILVLPILIPLFTAILSLLAWKRRHVQRWLSVVGTAALLGAACGDADPALLLACFEARLLTLLGYALRLDACASCHGSTGARRVFSAAAGGMVCWRCAPRHADGFAVTPGAAAFLRRLRSTPPGAASASGRIPSRRRRPPRCSGGPSSSISSPGRGPGGCFAAPRRPGGRPPPPGRRRAFPGHSPFFRGRILQLVLIEGDRRIRK